MENLRKEMQKNAVSILGVSEVRWKGQGEIRSGDYTVYYSEGERAGKGVVILVHKSVVRSVVKKIVYNDRIIAIKIQAEPINILMIQVYMPTSEHEDDEVEELYGIIEEILEHGKGNTNTIIMGDWNSVVGDEPYSNIVGPHGLGRKNQRGQMLINFCERNGLIVTNTWFRKPKKRLYTWKAPGDRSRHQLDYILVKHRFRKCERCADTAWGRYRLGLQHTSCQDLHQIEENHKVPKKEDHNAIWRNCILKYKECRIL